MNIISDKFTSMGVCFNILFCSIRRDVFMKAASEIVLTYPNERTGVYFIPGKPKTKTTSKTVNKGKLWNRYVNRRQSLGCYEEKQDNKSETDAQTFLLITEFLIILLSFLLCVLKSGTSY